VVSFRTGSSLPAKTFISGLNHYLPGDIAVKDAFPVSEPVNVRRDATSREYQYRILNSATRSPMQHGSALLVSRPLDIAAMNGACRHLVGQHDLASFATALEGSHIKSTVRRVYRAEVARDGEMVIFSMVASSFLPHQIRNTVGALIEVGLGRMTADGFRSILEARRPGLAGPAAPAHGLCLLRVNYPYSWEERHN
jgi:tRNA pseudouridine38-40 synthase